MTYWSIKSINKGKNFVQHTLDELKFFTHTLLIPETALSRVSNGHNFIPVWTHTQCSLLLPLSSIANETWERDKR